MNPVPAVPPGFHTITPHLVVSPATEAIAFYEKALGATEIFRNVMDGTEVVLHARLQIGDSYLMLNDEFPEQGVSGPAAGQTGVTVHLYVEDVDALYERATKAGAAVEFPLTDTFWGDRYAILRDPFGHRWGLASAREALTPEQIQERARAAFSAGS